MHKKGVKMGQSNGSNWKTTHERVIHAVQSVFGFTWAVDSGFYSGGLFLGEHVSPNCPLFMSWRAWTLAMGFILEQPLDWTIELRAIFCKSTFFNEWLCIEFVSCIKRHNRGASYPVTILGIPLLALLTRFRTSILNFIVQILSKPTFITGKWSSLSNWLLEYKRCPVIKHSFWWRQFHKRLRDLLLGSSPNRFPYLPSVVRIVRSS